MSQLDQLPPAALDSIRWMRNEWLPQMRADLAPEMNAIIDVYIQMELMLRQPENYDFAAEFDALQHRYANTVPTMAAWFANMRRHMCVAACDDDAPPPQKIEKFPIAVPAVPQSRAHYLLTWHADGKMHTALRKDPRELRTTMDALIRRGQRATLWADGEKIGGVECVPCINGAENGNYTRRWRGRIGAWIFFARTHRRIGL